MSDQEIQSIFDKLGLGASTSAPVFSGPFGSSVPPRVEIVVSTTSTPFA